MHKQKKRLTLRKIAQSTHSSLQRILQIELYGLLCLEKFLKLLGASFCNANAKVLVVRLGNDFRKK